MRNVVRFLFFTITYTVLCICVSGTEDLQGKKNFNSADNSLDNFIEKGICQCGIFYNNVHTTFQEKMSSWLWPKMLFSRFGVTPTLILFHA